MQTTSPEKTAVHATNSRLVVDELVGATEGYVVDASEYGPEKLARLKTTADGQKVLIPQPSDSPDDPLNWDSRKKYITLAIISLLTGLPDFISAAGGVTIIPQAAEWNTSELEVQHSLAGNVMGLAVGGIVALIFSNYFGNLPVLLAFHSFAFGTGAWCAAATSLNSFLIARILNGIFSSVGIATALMWIKSIFFFHEHPRAINIMVSSLIIAPYLSPSLAAFICARTSWRWIYWVATILNGIAWLCIVFQLDEPQYCRTNPTEDHNPPRGSRILRLFGIEQWRRKRIVGPTVGQAVGNPLIAVTKVAVLLILVYYFLVVSWLVGFNNTISVWLSEYYKFSLIGLGNFFLADILGAALGAVLGNWIHDLCGEVYSRRHGMRIQAEARLILVYPTTLLGALALLIVGFALQFTWHYMVCAVMAGLQVFIHVIATTAINAYLLDAYPEGSGEVCAWIVFARLTGGFMSTYVELPWVESAGPALSLGIQAAITAASLGLIAFLQMFGRRIRAKQGRMQFSLHN